MTNSKHDIATKDDIVLMVDSFYAKVNEDDILAYVFNDFAQVDWDIHLPKMYAFWNTLIFAKKDYKGNPFAHHIPLPIQKEHFIRWLALFEDTMNQLFEGPIAETTKARARLIARVFQSKLTLN
jgi:hemoglobin